MKQMMILSMLLAAFGSASPTDGKTPALFRRGEKERSK
jgi:hypothetical protein